MKIIEKATTPDGVKIQLEDWGNLLIGAYPVAQISDDSRFVVRGCRFRLTISSNNARADFEDLKIGAKTLKDLSANFYYPSDAALLGM